MRLSPLLRAFAAAAALVAASSAARAGWWDDLDKGESVKLSDVVAQPDPWKDKVVTFACIYHKLDTVYQPYFTRFDAEHWFNATVWYDAAPIWEMTSFRDDEFPFLYIARTTPQRDEWLTLLPFTRVEITGRVRDVYRKRPFVEVLGFRVTPATLGKHVVEWMKDGDASASTGDYVRAATYYRRVLAEISLEDVVKMRVKKRLGETLRAAGLPLEADKADGGGIAGGTPLPRPPESGAPGANPGAPGAPASGAPPPAFSPDLPPVASPSGAPSAPPTSPVTGADDLPGTPTGAITTDGLPGTPVDAGSPAKPPPAAPKSTPPMTLPKPQAGTPQSSAEGTPPPTPSADAPATAPPAPASAVPAIPASPPPAGEGAAPPAAPETSPATTTPPPPPPRTPRLSGVR